MSDERWSEAWCAAWAELPEILQTRKATIGAKYQYSYASLEDILSAVRRVLARHQLAITQSVVDAGPGRVGVITRIVHAGGWAEEYGPTVLPAEGDARSVGAAITYARRYSLTAALGISTEEDTDAKPVKPKAVDAKAAADPHERAWRYAFEAAGVDRAERIFMEALKAAGVVKRRIASPDEQRLVEEQVDALVAAET